MSEKPTEKSKELHPSSVPTTERVKLLVPIVVNGATIGHIDVRRPKVSDRKAAKSIKDDDERELFLLSRLTGLTPDDFEEMDMADFTAISDKIQSFVEARSNS
jgi:hypothetical protein